MTTSSIPLVSLSIGDVIQVTNPKSPHLGKYGTVRSIGENHIIVDFTTSPTTSLIITLLFGEFEYVGRAPLVFKYR